MSDLWGKVERSFFSPGNGSLLRSVIADLLCDCGYSTEREGNAIVVYELKEIETDNLDFQVGPRSRFIRGKAVWRFELEPANDGLQVHAEALEAGEEAAILDQLVQAILVKAKTATAVVEVVAQDSNDVPLAFENGMTELLVRLPSWQREAVDLWRKGFNESEIADKCGQPRDSVARRIVELRKKLGDDIVPYHGRRGTVE